MFLQIIRLMYCVLLIKTKGVNMNSAKWFICAIFVCIFILYSNLTVQAEEKKFMIPPFENFSPCKARTEYEVTYNDTGDPTTLIKKTFEIDQYSEAARSLLENRMVNMKAKMIERRRIDQMICESKLTRETGYINEESALKMGKIIGADTLLMGTILNIQNKNETVKSYNLNEKISKTICSIRIRIINIESGDVFFSETAMGEAVSSSSNYGENIDSDSAYTALAESIKNLFAMDSFKKNIQKYINK